MSEHSLTIVFGRRTGTSTMAKGLLEAGFNLPGPLDLRELPSNPGHYECVPVRDEIDGMLMRHYRHSDHHPGLLPFVRYKPIEAWSEDNPGDVVVKNPRMCMTWPVWYRTLKGKRSLRGIWCRRDKEEQAQSLYKHYSQRSDDAQWCVEMYENCIGLAAQYMPMLEVDLTDVERVSKASAWLEGCGVTRVPAPGGGPPSPTSHITQGVAA